MCEGKDGFERWFDDESAELIKSCTVKDLLEIAWYNGIDYAFGEEEEEVEEPQGLFINITDDVADFFKALTITGE